MSLPKHYEKMDYEINGHKLFLKCDSICVHGDNEKALEFVKLVRKALI